MGRNEGFNMHRATPTTLDIADVITALCDANEWELALELARTADAWRLGEHADA